MSIELSLKNFTIDEVYNVAVNNHKVKVGRILSNELSQSKPKKVKAKNTELVDIKYPTKIRKTEYLIESVKLEF